MKWLKALQIVALGLGLAYTLPLACGSGGVVGGKCKDGYVTCDGRCVDLRTDRQNCASCGNECSGKLACAEAQCGGPDGNMMVPQGGASNTGGTANEAGAGTAAASQGGDGELPDGGFFDSPVDGQPDAETPIECLPPFDSPSNCGACGNVCMKPNPLCGPDGEGGFHCVPKCIAPLVECNGQCLDPDSFNSDPDNCGRCGNKCPSDICQSGKCVGARYGNIALLCMDFNSAMSTSGPTTLLGNAVFAPAKNPVRVLSYTRGSSAAAVNRVHQVIDWAGGARGRSAEITEAKTADVVTGSLNINDFDVFLVHDLDQAKPGEPAAAATTWESGSVLSSFGRAGGVIVVVDGGDGIGEMNQLINAGKLLDPDGKVTIDSQTELLNEQVWNNAPFDVLGVNVISPFLGTSHTCTFDITGKIGSDTILVLGDDETGGSPVAIHRVIAP